MSSRHRKLKYFGQSERKVWPEDHLHEQHPRSARKDTKRWCRGKAGVEHEPVISKRRGEPWSTRGCHPPDAWQLRVWPFRTWICVHDERCGNCGRVLRRYLTARECPDHPGKTT